MGMSPRLLRPRATGFSPKNISGLVGWWDAADSSTITVATGVSDWRDKSGVGSGKTLLQTTANNQPAYTATIGGKAAILYDGTNDELVTSGNVTIIGADYTWTVFSVCRADAQGGGGIISQDDFSATRPPQYQRLWSGTFPSARSARVFLTNAADSAVGAISGLAVLQSTPFVLSSSQSSDTSNIWVNGANNGTASVTPKAVQFSKKLYIGSIGSGSFFAGAIGEAIIYSPALTTSERQSVERYLGTKWGITVA
jgi:hypothetical protein